jgi:hypothetical protein
MRIAKQLPEQVASHFRDRLRIVRIRRSELKGKYFSFIVVDILTALEVR